MEAGSAVGVVVIGRNEGERLARCFDSILPRCARVVYVDSGSTDDSLDLARERGVDVVLLDLSIPFSAARARNAGFERLVKRSPELRFVQFVDGDCEVDPGWLQHAADRLESESDLAVVCGRRREKYPEASRYNLLCDLEWDTPVGEAAACGGDALMRIEAFEQAGGFDPSLIAGEEPELCVRLRLSGWRVFRLDAEMTLHDAAITRFSQWWTRMVRAGHAYAEGAFMHGLGPTRHFAKPVASSLWWGLGLPALGGIAAGGLGAWGLGVLAAYPLQWLRIYRGQRRRERPARSSRLYATFVLLGKFAALQGIGRFVRSRLLGKKSALIEYK